MRGKPSARASFNHGKAGRPFLCAGLFLVAVAWLWAAAAPRASWADTAARTYFEPQSLPPQLLPPPPAEGSGAWKAQIEAVRAAQRSLPPAEISAIRHEQNFLVALMTDTLEPSFSRERLPRTAALLDRVECTTEQVVDAHKRYWHTRRPYLADPRIRLCVDSTATAAYPSGHTAESRVLAEVLGMLFPDQLPRLRARAEDVARHRIEAGVHYPVDIEGGRSLALLVVGALTANSDFQTDMQAAREELAGR
ncbi:MAG TPA: phosphatase PAP2 family protein [Candidatus Edwardsbacteria bacterium]|nr:phosphatase PAP2 family protein [Candidatus Edwardsbacteria bacterium]